MPTLAEGQKSWDDLAGHYHEDVITPFDPDVDFRLRRDVDRILCGWQRDGSWGRRVVMDFGCGIGESFELVAGRVGVAAGVDFSAGMLDETQRRLERKGIGVHRLAGPQSLRQLNQRIDRRSRSSHADPLTILAQGNLLHLGAVSDLCDLAFSINSTAAESEAQAYRMIGQIVSSVRVGGIWIAVFPSLDSVAYLHRLHRRHGVPSDGLGRVANDGRMYIHGDGQRQKFFNPDEIKQLCKSRGCHVQRLDKIRYPWKLIARYGWGYFPRSPRLWDWYLVAMREA